MAYEKSPKRRKSLGDVLKEYNKISEAKESDPPTQLYKSIVELTGQVFLITDPAKWGETHGEFGKTYKQRPAPIPMGNINDLPTENKSPLALPSAPKSWGVDSEF
jgi:hypothetical protein